MCLWSRLRGLWRNVRHRRLVDKDLDRELESYVDLVADELRDRGHDPDSARRAARLQMGGIQQVRERVREVRSGAGMETFWSDVRIGLRLLLRTPSYVVAAVASLALGIAAIGAVFGLLNALQLRALPVPHAGELAAIRLDGPRCCRHTGRNRQVSVPLWNEIAAHQQAFSGLFAFADTRFNLAPRGEVRYVEGMFVSGGFFSVLGVPAVMGRTLGPADDRPGCANAPAVISHALWQREFGGRPDVLTESITWGSSRHPIAGVMPAWFFGVEVGRRFDVAMPLCASGFGRHDHWWLAVMGRLKRGWTLSQADAHLAALGPSLLTTATPPTYDPEQAKAFAGLRLSVLPAANGVSPLRSQYREPLWLLLALAAVVLLTACANGAALSIVRATTRERELALRAALGATPMRIVRQLVVEGALVVLAAAAAGFLLARVAQDVVLAVLSTRTDPIVLDIRGDWRMLAFTTLLIAFTTAAFAAAPAIRATRTAHILTPGSRTTSGRTPAGTREVLLGIQIALSVVLVSATLLFVLTVRNLSKLDPGFAREDVLVANVFLNERAHPPESRAEVSRRLTADFEAIPGIAGVAHATVPPLSGSSWGTVVRIPDASGERRGEADRNQVSTRYFAVMGIPVVEGRSFDDRDTLESAKVALINEAFARKFFGDGSPIGRHAIDAGQEFEIVGLVGNTKLYSLREAFRPMIFTAASQVAQPASTIRFVLRSQIDAGPAFDAVRQALGRVSPSSGVRFATLSGMVDDSMQRERLLATLSTFFGVVAMALAALGVYGVVAYASNSRSREIAIRVALGARAADVIHSLLGRIAIVGGVGLVFGCALTFAAGASASSFLYGVEPQNPTLMGVIVGLIALSAVAAAVVPARRALRTDPVIALKAE